MAQLPSTASIKDIIAALQTMEAINQKADLAAVVGSPALSTDDVATIISKLQTQKDTLAINLTNKGVSSVGSESLKGLVDKVGSLVIGRKWASGTGTIGSTIPMIRVTGLVFQPRLVILEFQSGGYKYRQVGYRDGLSTILDGFRLSDNGNSGSYNSTYQLRLLASSFEVDNNGFGGLGVSFTWLAYE